MYEKFGINFDYTLKFKNKRGHLSKGNGRARLVIYGYSSAAYFNQSIF